MESLDRVMIKTIEELSSRIVLQARIEEQDKQLALLREELSRRQATPGPPSRTKVLEANQKSQALPARRTSVQLASRPTYAEAAATTAPAEKSQRKASVASPTSRTSKNAKSRRPVLDTARTMSNKISDQAELTEEEVLQAKTKFADAIKPHETGSGSGKYGALKIPFTSKLTQKGRTNPEGAQTSSRSL